MAGFGSAGYQDGPFRSAVAALGPVPEDPLDRLDWQKRAASIGAWPDLSGHCDPADPIGPSPWRPPQTCGRPGARCSGRVTWRTDDVDDSLNFRLSFGGATALPGLRILWSELSNLSGEPLLFNDRMRRVMNFLRCRTQPETRSKARVLNNAL
jgi:hypothetical protein